jgi:signal transduction histidine kinase/ActR/RegA family two-component response regulator
MAPNTAFNFFVLAVGILGMGARRREQRQLAEFAALLVFFISLLALVGYLYGELSLVQVQSYIPMAVHTAFCFIVQSLCALFVQRESRLAALFLERGSAGTLVRLMFPVAILVPTLLGALCLLGAREGYYPYQLAGALLAVASMVLFCVLISHTARRLKVLDQQRNEAELRLVAANSDLENRVRERTEALALSIAEERKLEGQLQRAQRLESLGALAGGIAHDLNNALSPILLGLELLKPRATTPKEQRLLDTLSTCAHRGTALVRQILAFARGRENSGQTHVPHLMQEIQKMAQNTFPKSIEIRTDASEDLWEVRVDTTQLYQVLLNLCVNARDAMSEGGLLTLRARNCVPGEAIHPPFPKAPTGPHVLISVSDTGSGIPPDLQERIFEPFFTTKQPDQGTGLGLSMVMNILRSHGGQVQLESAPGQGATFHLLLPAVLSSTQHMPELPPELPPGASQLILLVDDEEAVREMCKSVLEAFNYRVITAKHGAEAIVVFQSCKERIGLVIVDTEMPLMDGPATILALRKLDPQVKFLVASGAASLKKIPFAKYLSKPYSARELLETVADCCGGIAPIREERPACP